MTSDSLLEIAEQHGSPLYVYDAHKIQSQYERLHRTEIRFRAEPSICSIL